MTRVGILAMALVGLVAFGGDGADTNAAVRCEAATNTALRVECLRCTFNTRHIPATKKGEQCRALTIAGHQCSNGVSMISRFFCTRHEQSKERNDPKDEVIQCCAYTAAGYRCRRNPDPGSKYCWQHGREKEPISAEIRIVAPLDSVPRQAE